MISPTVRTELADLVGEVAEEPLIEVVLQAQAQVSPKFLYDALGSSIACESSGIVRRSVRPSIASWMKAPNNATMASHGLIANSNPMHNSAEGRSIVAVTICEWIASRIVCSLCSS